MNVGSAADGEGGSCRFANCGRVRGRNGLSSRRQKRVAQYCVYIYTNCCLVWYGGFIAHNWAVSYVRRVVFCGTAGAHHVPMTQSIVWALMNTHSHRVSFQTRSVFLVRGSDKICKPIYYIHT